jgi:HPt (histidine-containing phosphotransfer) domain-containing protein
MAGTASWSLDALVSQLAGDEDLARQMVALFISESPRMRTALVDAFASGSPDAVRRAAHSFKGAVSNFSEEGLTATARLLEQTAAEGRLDDAAALFERLEQEADDLVRVMGQFT